MSMDSWFPNPHDKDIAQLEEGLSYRAIKSGNNWILPSGKNAANGDPVVLDGVFGYATAAIVGGTDAIVEDTNWKPYGDGGALVALSSKSIEEITITFENNFYCETDIKLRGYKMTKPDGTGIVVLSGKYKTSVDMASGEHKIATMSVTATRKVEFPTGQYTKANDNGLYVNASIQKYANNYIYTGVFTI